MTAELCQYYDQGPRSVARLRYVNTTAGVIIQPRRSSDTLVRAQCGCSPVKSRGSITTTSSWSACASFRCCEISPRSSSRVLRGNGGSCSARSPSWFSLCPARGTSIPSGYSSRTDRNMPLRKRPASRCLSPFGDGMQQLLSPTSLRASKQTTSPRVYIRAVT